MSRDDADRVADIFGAIEAITLAEEVMSSHDGDHRIAAVCIDAITYRVFTIGEATKELSSESKDAHPNVPWSNIAKMRDLIGHHYYRRDPEIIFATIREP
ncbi:MAG: HepT-like ribonuclease domain-containing protein, partial [Actinomycetota bacterium]